MAFCFACLFCLATLGSKRDERDVKRSRVRPGSGYRKMAGGKFDDLHFVKTNNSMLQTCNKNSHTVDGSEILANHLRCIKPCKLWDEVPTSTGAGFLSSTVTLTLFFGIHSIERSDCCRLLCFFGACSLEN